VIYLDNAATTFIKPQAVTEAVMNCIRFECGNPGRGAHAISLAAAERIYACREALSDFFGVGAPERVIFTLNTTHALNLAIKGVLGYGDHALISELEHNAVRRPLYALAAQGVQFDVFPVVGLDTEAILRGIRERLTPKTAALITTHASNICSISLPIRAIGALCKEKGIRLIVDAAQSAGHLPIDLRDMQISALALPAHKALFGIQGCGALLLAEGMDPKPLLEGGSGVDSAPLVMPNEPPERYEAGTLPTPAIAGLLAGLNFVRSLGLDEIRRRTEALFLAARERLLSFRDLELYQADAVGSVLLFNHRQIPSTELARTLDREGIAVRAGLHCAPLAHRALGTPAGGAVRLGFSSLNTPEEIDALYSVLRRIV